MPQENLAVRYPPDIILTDLGPPKIDEIEFVRRLRRLGHSYGRIPVIMLTAIELLTRSFTVDRPLEDAWRRLARVEQWPSWAKHIRRVKAEPAEGLGPKSTGYIQLSNGMRSAFTMTEFKPYTNWKWVGRFLWLTVCYDHRFEELSPTQTKLTWVVEASGVGVSIFGRLFAKVYAKNLDQAIPLLVNEINANRV